MGLDVNYVTTVYNRKAVVHRSSHQCHENKKAGKLDANTLDRIEMLCHIIFTQKALLTIDYSEYTDMKCRRPHEQESPV